MPSLRSMQPYERIGLVALMFLVVLLAVGALWDDGSGDDTVLAAERPEIERVDEEAAARAAAEARKAEKIRAVQATARGAVIGRPGTAGSARTMPMGGQDEVASGVSRVTTVSNGSDHRREPLAHDAPGGGAAASVAGARAQGPEELQDFARPHRPNAGTGGGMGDESNETVPMNARSLRRRTTTQEPRSNDTSREARSAAPEPVAATRTAEPAVTAAAKAPKARTYTVQPGDALQKIAARELGDRSLSATIASLNGLSDPDMIRVGMVLTLPTTSSSVAAVGASAANVAASSATSATGSTSGASAGSTYTIQPGESLSAALTRELGTYRRSIALVKALNPGLNPDRVLAGQVIQLPRAEDIPGESRPKAANKAGSETRGRSAAPALDTSPGSSTVAAAERSSASKSVRSDSEFVVR